MGEGVIDTEYTIALLFLIFDVVFSQRESYFV